MNSFGIFITNVIFISLLVLVTTMMYKYLSRPKPPLKFLAKPYTWLNSGSTASLITKVSISFFIGTFLFVFLIIIFILSTLGGSKNDYYYD